MIRAVALLVLFASPSAMASECRPVFVVERSLNANRVVYEAERGEIDPARPMRGHWEMRAEDGRREELTVLENRLAYGVDVLEATPDSVVVVLRALPARRIEIRLSEGCPVAVVPIAGRAAVLQRIFVHLRTGSLVPKVDHVDLVGEDPESGLAAEERIEAEERGALPGARTAGRVARVSGSGDR